MTTNSIPTAQAFSQLSTVDQDLILDLHLHQIEYEIDGLRTGYMWTTDGRSRTHHLKLRARRRCLVNLAQSFGYWEENDQTEAAYARGVSSPPFEALADCASATARALPPSVKNFALTLSAA